ncbi:MAG: tRNA uridine-5-carboxymethylaminomethyl(34) synthesis GTPase MnmE [Rickettsiaceae bacterium]|jgi:tRNA modification GTPase|nr:tRNA uridine-5-carboxymethylaminomethyl(34) synthesis GTPase MnmE [Rickettsiaceae bacterium]
MNTIFAQASAPGKAGVSVFRISGPTALQSLTRLVCQTNPKFEPRKLYFRKIYNPKNHQQIDDALVVFFKGTSSFTGEDSVEIYTHGSIAVIKMMHQVLASLEDVRIAEPGEFAKRAFLNGKIDLTSAEGLADLIEAETALQLSQAIGQLGGGLEKIYEGWRLELLKIISLVEAYIDFPDEDIPEETINAVRQLVDRITNEIEIHLNDNHRGERLRSGIKLAIIGHPNVGKSSLLNYLMKREIAIVSNIAGTTRDVVEGHLDIGGYPIILQDTAGIHDHTEDIIEQEGINRAWNAAKNSDIKIILYDASRMNDLNEYFKDIIDANTIIVFNKIDLVSGALLQNIHGHKSINVSIKNEQGLNEIIAEIVSIADKIARPSQSPQITRARHRSQLQKALEYMSNFSLNDDLVLAAEDLRMTMRAISNITGKITVDEILGEIFSNFCIGK